MEREPHFLLACRLMEQEKVNRQSVN
jgi:hypothetical protein